MKVDYRKFPEIPPGYSTNYNKARDVYQVYRDYRVFDPVKGKNVTRRETIGQIKDGKFRYSKLYLARQENDRLTQELQDQTQQSQSVTKSVASRVNKAVKSSQLDRRQQSKVIWPIEPIVLAAMISALRGDTDCTAIAQLLGDKASFFRKLYPEMPKVSVTHDTVYLTLLKVKAERFDAFYQQIVSSLVAKTSNKVVAADAQTCRSTWKHEEDVDSGQRPLMLMNFYDTNSRICLSQMLIGEKTNELTVTPTMLENMDIKDCIITADAMNCQWNFVERILDAGADFCLFLKGNQDKASKEVIGLFATTHPDQIEEYVTDCELNHDCIEERTVSLIGGHLLSDPIRRKWKGLENGCVVRVRAMRTFKTTGRKTADDRYYICSLPAEEHAAKRIGEVVRSHWAIESQLYWALDVHFDQDRMKATNTDYISNRVALNKLALKILENYRYWLWLRGETNEVLTTKTAMRHCRNFDNALNCIARSRKLI